MRLNGQCAISSRTFARLMRALLPCNIADGDPYLSIERSIPPSRGGHEAIPNNQDMRMFDNRTKSNISKIYVKYMTGD